MIAAIIDRLKTGRITNVVPYGSAPMPEPPYVVVKVEDQFNGYVGYRIITHMMPGQQLFLDDYVREDLSDLLSFYECDDRHGAHHRLDGGFEEGNETYTNNDDGTISKERVFLEPSIKF